MVPAFFCRESCRNFSGFMSLYVFGVLLRRGGSRSAAGERSAEPDCDDKHITFMDISKTMKYYVCHNRLL